MESLFSIENILFSIGDQGVSLVEVLSVATGLACVYLATRAKVANFWIGYVYNIMLFILFYQKGLYSSMLVQPISFAINFFGHWRWTHPAKEEANSIKQLKITLLSGRERIYHLAIMVVFMILWGVTLTYLDNIFPSVFSEAKKPFLDAFVTGAILTAQYLSAQKKLDCWGVWFIVNITNITLYMLAGLAFLPMVSAGYLILAFMGFAMWKKMWKENK